MTPSGDVTVLVMAAPNRGGVAERCRASIEASDIGRSYEWHEHPAGLTVLEHFRAIMARAVTAESRLVLFLEDDALVNRHIVHNLTTWPDVDDARFGVGWLIHSGDILDYIYKGRANGRGRWLRRPYLHISAGLLFRTADLPELLTHVYAWQNQRAGTLAHTDLAVSHGVWDMGRQICVHAPSLIEHQIQDSKLGNRHHWKHDTSNGTFRREWRRA